MWNFVASARTTQSRDACRRARSVRISGIESFIRARSGPIAPIPMYSVSRPQLAQGQLGDVAERRVHPDADDAAEDDELDAGTVHEDGRHVEGVGDDGEAAVHEPPRELQRRRAARDEDRLAVLDVGGGGIGDGGLGGGSRIRDRRERRTAELGAAVRPDDPTVARQPGEVAPDRRGRDAEVPRQAADGDAAVGADPVEQQVAAGSA